MIPFQSLFPWITSASIYLREGSLGNRPGEKDLCETNLLRSDLDIYAHKEIAEVTLGRGKFEVCC